MNIKFTLPTYLVEIIGQDLAGLKSDIDTVRLPPAAKEILHGVKNFIIQRLKIMEEEIAKEELALENRPYIHMKFSDDPLAIEYFYYSTALENKMKDSISNDDFIYLEKFAFKKGAV